MWVYHEGQGHAQFDEEHVQVFAGDLNLREGEEEWFSQEKWIDVMEAGSVDGAGESWRWKKGKAARMRFDRIYSNASHRFCVVCVEAKRLPGLWVEGLTSTAQQGLTAFLTQGGFKRLLKGLQVFYEFF